MNIRERLASLCPPPISWEVTDTREDDPIDLAYALAGCSELQTTLLRTKYALELGRLYDLGRMFWFYVIDLHQAGVLPFDRVKGEFRRKLSNLGMVDNLRKNPDFVLSLTNLVLHDHIHHHTCTVCKGRSNLVVEAETLRVGAEVHKKGSVLVCFNCAGLGRKPQTGRERARIMDVPYETWRKNYEPLFRELSNLLDQEESDGAKIVRERLG